MKTSDLDYERPGELIAQAPLPRRDASRLLVYDRWTGELGRRAFSDLPDELPDGTLLVVNDTRVVPARLHLLRPGGGEAEVLLVERRNGVVWEALARPSRRLRPGMRLAPPKGDRPGGAGGNVELLESLGGGRWLA